MQRCSRIEIKKSDSIAQFRIQFQICPLTGQSILGLQRNRCHPNLVASAKGHKRSHVAVACILFSADASYVFRSGRNSMEVSFRHVAIVVRSMEKMLPFYRDILGFRIKRDFTIGSPEFQKGIGLRGAFIWEFRARRWNLNYSSLRLRIRPTPSGRMLVIQDSGILRWLCPIWTGPFPN